MHLKMKSKIIDLYINYSYYNILQEEELRKKMNFKTFATTCFKIFNIAF